MELFQVDAFTDRPFAGNPAAVCLIDAEVDSEWMQSLAMEMNLAETAFVRAIDDGYELRWFTPTDEVDLCGHATLASAHVLYETGRLETDRTARFHTRSGVLTASRTQDGSIELDFPADPVSRFDPSPDLTRALGVTIVSAHRGKQYVLIEVPDADAVRQAQPDVRRLASLGLEVILTARSDSEEYDFISRFFAPGLGVDEDSVTGSAHCTLAGFWSRRLGRAEMVGYQASQRGGFVRVRCVGDRVKLIGAAVTIMRAELDPAACPAPVC